jgi:hypothetical protein
MRMVKLSNAHIVISRGTATQLFGDAARVCWVYYPQRKTMLIAAGQDALFKSLHKTADSIFKYSNGKGDRSIAIRELLIDNELDDADRELVFTADIPMHILTINF